MEIRLARLVAAAVTVILSPASSLKSPVGMVSLPSRVTAQISTLISENGINIDTMTNRSKKDNAYTVLDVESDVAEDTLDKIRAIEGVVRVRKV